MKKTHTVVMLPTEKASTLGFAGDKLHYSKTEGEKTSFYIPQHLYILSDEEIKEGDWFIHINLKKTFKCCKASSNTIWANDMEMGDMVNRCKKVIATRDKSLKVITGIVGSGTGEQLPQIPQSFVPIFVKAYNEGNPITEVELECKGTMNWDIKLTESNEVIISLPEEKMYSKKEIMNLIEDILLDTDIVIEKFGESTDTHKQCRLTITIVNNEISQIEGLDKWIEKNLE